MPDYAAHITSRVSRMPLHVHLVALTVASLFSLSWTGRCPPPSSVYLMHGGYCLPEYTVISDKALTADNPLHCVLAGSSGIGGRGKWTVSPNNTAVQCEGSGSGPFNCSQSSDPTSITLYKKTGASLSGKQLYTCTISGQSISVQINASNNNTVLLAIYIEPPADVRSVPQNYTIHCITTGQNTSSITVGLYLEKHGISHYNQQHIMPPVSGYDQTLPFLSTLNSAMLTYDYSEEVLWRANKVEVDGTEFSVQGLTKYNGDHDWACRVDIVDSYEDLQTYIKAPNFTPTNLTVIHKNATSVTISWTAVNATDADGYVVYFEQLSDAYDNSLQTRNRTAVDVGNTTQYTLRGIIPVCIYSITVRAYQDLLGPESVLSETFEVLFQPLNWSLVSDRTSPEVQYRVYCTAAYVAPDHIVWEKNDITITMNSTIATISYQLVDEDTDNYTNILTITGDHHTQNISCAAECDSGTLIDDELIIIEAPSGPPVGVAASINSSSSITVSWSPPVGGADGYVILYSTEGSNNMTQLVGGGDQTSSLLTGLNEGHLYTIRMFAYEDLPSLLSDHVQVMLDIPGPVSNVSVITMQPPVNVTTISWTPPTAQDTPVSQYIVTYTNTCPSDKHNTQSSGGVTVNSSSTSTTVTLQLGQLYNISVSASNAVGVSPAVSVLYWTSASHAPSVAPDIVNVSSVDSSSIDINWGEVPCEYRNGEITEYVVVYRKVLGRGRAERRQTREEMVIVNGQTATIDNLDPLTEYSVMVAAVNSAGTGVFSEPVTAITKDTAALPVVIIGGAVGGAVLIMVLLVMIIAVILIVRKIKSKTRKKKHADPIELTRGMYENVENPLANDDDKQSVVNEYSEVKDMIPDYQNASVMGTQAQEQQEASYTNVYSTPFVDKSFDPLIPVTLPVPLAEMSTYVESCHSDYNRALHSQYEELYCDEDNSLASVGFSIENIPRNRFKNITAYDSNRVVLKSIEGYEHDFINASHLDGYSSSKKFIASQGPTKKTVVDFWRMIWQERLQYIVMVTNVMEGGKGKCEQYWPQKGQESQSFGPFIVSVLKDVTLPDFTVRTLKVENGQSSITTTQYHFTSWPDHGVPEYGTPLMILHKKVMAGWRRGDPPILVHCSAGVGRTGTFITIDLALEQAKKEGVVDIAGIVNRLRQQRMQMVQTVQQYIFLHDAILEYVICGETEIPSDKLPTELAELKMVNPATGKSRLQDQFELLARVTPSPDNGIFTTALNHPDKNRKQDYLPNECNRVILKGEYPGYIHASFVNGYREKKTFIIAQSPLENTVKDFWKMVVDYRVPAVVMLCDLNEDNTLCPYWPQGSGTTAAFGEVVLKTESETIGEGFVKRSVKISQEGQKAFHTVHFQVTLWSPTGVTENPGLVIALMDTVLSVCRKKERGPVVVQCSDTVGRSGTYCAISNALEQCKAEGVVDVFQTVKGVRMQKLGAVTSQEQYNFVFDVVVAFLATFENYANFV